MDSPRAISQAPYGPRKTLTRATEASVPDPKPRYPTHGARLEAIEAKLGIKIEPEPEDDQKTARHKQRLARVAKLGQRKRR